MSLNMDIGGLEEADSGDEEGEGSVKSGDEWAVVGDEAVEAVVRDAMLPR